MKNMLTIALLALWAPAFALMSPDLEGVLSRADEKSLVDVDIVFQEQMDTQLLTSLVKDLPRPERRAAVARILTDFSTQRQAAVMSYLREMERAGKVTDIRSFWINNAIYCRAVPEVIYALEARSEVYYVDYDLRPIALEKNPMTPAPADATREIAWGVLKVNADDVWALGYTGDGVVVGLVDTGCNYNHVDLNDHIWTDPNYPHHGWDFENNDNDPMDSQGHGTHCSGSVASDGTAGSQCGVAPDAQIIACRVRTTADSTAENQVWAAWEFVVSPPLSPTHGCDVITMSLGWQYAWAPRRATWRTNSNNVGAAGIVQCVAAGNERDYNYPPEALRCPGDCPPPWRHPQNGATGALGNVISIGATDINDLIADFSSPGPVTWQTIAPFNDYIYPPGLTTPSVSAPGVNIKSLNYASNTGYLDGWNGTSMATPHVAGVVALMLQKNPYLTQTEIDSILETTAVDLGTLGKDNDYGAGRIDALAAVNATPYPGTPFTPTIVSPFDYARLPSLTPTLRATTTDPQGDPIRYRVYYDTDTLFDDPDSFTTASFASGAVAEITFPSALADGETYWWKLRAADTTAAGTWSGATARRSLTIGTSLPANSCSWFQTTGEQFAANSMFLAQIAGDSIILMSVGYIEDTLLHEDFEGAGIPAGWTVVDANNDGDQWAVGTTSDLGGNTPPDYGTHYAYYSDDDAGSGAPQSTSEELISPALYTTGITAALTLEYGWGYNDYSSYDAYYVRMRRHTGGGWTAWVQLRQYTVDGSGTEVIDLSSYLPCDSIQFEWQFVETSASWNWACAVDNVLVSYDYTFANNSGTVTSTPVIYQDLAVTYPRTHWGDAIWHKATAGDSVGIQVEYYNGSTWALVPDGVLPGNSTGFFTTLAIDTVSLAGLDTVTYHTLRLHGMLERLPVDAPGDPALLDWEIGNLSAYYGVAELGAAYSGSLLHVYPSVSAKGITINCAPLTAAHLELRIYDAAGRCVKTLYRGKSPAGDLDFEWRGSDDMGRNVPAGVYFVRLDADAQRQVVKAVLLR